MCSVVMDTIVLPQRFPHCCAYPRSYTVEARVTIDASISLPVAVSWVHTGCAGDTVSVPANNGSATCSPCPFGADCDVLSATGTLTATNG